MQLTLAPSPAPMNSDIQTPGPGPGDDLVESVVSTHVLVSEDQVQRLRELSRRTRVAQSEYLREAVEDLLNKYGRGEGGLK
jgi:hypothetical protein